MTNRERLNAMTDEELSDAFCDAMESVCTEADIDMCYICPFTKVCKKGNNGFLHWLKAEAKEGKNI